MARLTVLLLLALVLYAPSAWPAPKWVAVGTHAARNDATATVFIDANSIVKTGKLIRAWVVTDFTEHQEGDWTATDGNSRACMSYRQLLVIDCRTKDMGYGSWAALDGRMGTGSVVHSIAVPVPTTASFPAAPGTIGEAIVSGACKRAK